MNQVNWSAHSQHPLCPKGNPEVTESHRKSQNVGSCWIALTLLHVTDFHGTSAATFWGCTSKGLKRWCFHDFHGDALRGIDIEGYWRMKSLNKGHSFKQSLSPATLCWLNLGGRSLLTTNSSSSTWRKKSLAETIWGVDANAARAAPPQIASPKKPL